MRRFAFSGAALAAFAAMLAPPAAAAPTGAARTMKCPIGGAEFEWTPMLPPAALGYRPDGKPYGAGAAPPALPECPDNGLILYKDYSADEIERLAPLVASGDYQALRRDAQYYRAYWLMKQMGVDSRLSLLALLQAAWQSDDRPEMRARYLAEFAEETGKVEPRPEDINWIGMEARAIDALRELGRFDEAEARLARVPLDSLQGSNLVADSAADEQKAQLKRTWLTFFEQLKAAIARKDSDIEPLDMIPRQVALNYCIERLDSLDAHQKAFCAKEKSAVAEMKAALGSSQVDLKPLSRPRSESGR
jgi:hypothetical protein